MVAALLSWQVAQYSHHMYWDGVYQHHSHIVFLLSNLVTVGIQKDPFRTLSGPLQDLLRSGVHHQVDEDADASPELCGNDAPKPRCTPQPML